MNTKKNITGGIAGAVTSFLLGNLLYLFVFKTYFDENSFPVDTNSINWLYAILSSLCWGFMFVYILDKLKVSTLSNAALTGLVIGLLLEGGVDFNFYSMGMLYKNLTVVISDVLLIGIIDAAICSVIFYVGNFGKK
jgi:hypothetical protein